MSKNDERRRFFRIEDSVHLNLTAVPSGELAHHIEDLEHRVVDGFTLMATLEALSQQVAASLRRIEAKTPDVADYLKILDKKLDLIAQAFLAEGVDLVNQPTRMVNLSASGMAVHSRDPFDPGQALEIKMLLLPSYTGILTYGTVIECASSEGADADPSYPYRLRIDFSFMRDHDRDALIRHVLLKQAEGLRRRRGRQEHDDHAVGD